uniref:Uncharacterized protein LOC104242402 isoform X1 n=1 Tax=Nicotiana sylvestris TaxID=4096 RepID=A0A1U7XXV0_NICSY|nr:PREDICTED: uncharacterized protein LOC104242402 isoform X1 [Nicotiana sylvestris]
MGFTHTFAVVERDAITRLSTSCCFKPRTSGEEINAQFLSILSFLSRIHVYDASSGSINALVCLSTSVCKLICLWNPLIHQTKLLPMHNIKLQKTRKCCVSFGYEQNSDDYKVI